MLPPLALFLGLTADPPDYPALDILHPARGGPSLLLDLCGCLAYNTVMCHLLG